MICCLSLSSHFYCQVDDLSKEPQVERELMLIKLNADSNTKGEVRKRFFVLFLFFFFIFTFPKWSSMAGWLKRQTYN